MFTTTTTSQRTAVLPVLLLALATSANALNALTYKGCFSASAPLSDQGTNQFQTSGVCQALCVGKNNAVLGLSGGGDCWCGDQLPVASALVDDSKCSTPCFGFGTDKCGGTNYWSVYFTGTSNDVTNAGAAIVSQVAPAVTTTTAAPAAATTSSSSSSTTETTSSATSTSSSTTAAATLVSSVTPVNTIVVTVSASATSTASPDSGSSGTSVAGIAAGVVVGVLGAAALLGGVFFWLRHRRRRQAEEDYKHSAQVADFMRNGSERKPPGTGYSQMSDSRLDPEAGRRNSVGSMADEQDYSRKILRIANPDWRSSVQTTR